MSVDLRTRPRGVVHRDRVLARGLLISTCTGELSRMRAGLLAIHEPGTRVYAFDDRLVLVWAKARWLDADRSLGIPLIAGPAALLSACPLDERERARIVAIAGPKFEGIVWAEAGVLRHATLDPEAEVDVAAWLDLDGFERIEVASLRAPARAPAWSHAPAKDADRLLADATPSFVAERADVIAEMIAELEGRGSGSPGSAALAAAATPAKPWTTRLRDALKRLFLGRGPIAEVLRNRQAEYLREMIAKFESGDLDDALRWAIPTSTLERQPAPPSFSGLSPRSSLDIQRHESGGGSSIAMGPDLFARVRAMYQRSAEALEAKGRIDEAAFVWFELLHDNLGGIALLERHRRFRMAAEIAEARELAPELAIRLWFIAGDSARAVALARRSGAFAAAVAMLERRDRPAADSLRSVWAKHLAATGDFAGAVEAIWPIDHLRGHTEPWIDRALEHAGPVQQAKLLLRKLEVRPTALAEVFEAIEPSLRASDDEAQQMRIQLGQELQKGPRGAAALMALARPLARALLPDLLGPRASEARQSLIGLDRARVDPLLSADLPKPLPSSDVITLIRRTSPRIHDLADAGTGQRQAVAIAALPKGGCLVALAEGGVLHLRSDGRVRRYYEVPAQHLAVAEQGGEALALAERDGLMQIWRIDLGDHAVRWWCDLKLDRWAPRFEGGQWFVAMDQALVALDLLGAVPTMLWRLGMPDSSIDSIELADQRLDVEVDGPAGLERWEFELPKRTLRRRHDRSAATRVQVCASTSQWLAIRERADECEALVLSRRSDGEVVLRLLDRGATRLSCSIVGETLWAIDDRRRAWSIALIDGALRVVLL